MHNSSRREGRRGSMLNFDMFWQQGDIYGKETLLLSLDNGYELP
jgi:hypothetical protein